MPSLNHMPVKKMKKSQMTWFIMTLLLHKDSPLVFFLILLTVREPVLPAIMLLQVMTHSTLTLCQLLVINLNHTADEELTS